MTQLDFDPDLERLGAALHASTTADLAREERATRLAFAGGARRAGAAAATHAPRRRPRPRLLAGSTLGLAALGAALVLVLGGSSVPPAYAITTSSDGSVLVHLNINSSLPQVNAKLAAMGTHEQIGIQMAQGPAAVSGPVTCSPAKGVAGPTVRVLDGPNGTEVISPGQTGDNTGVGTWHLASCGVYAANTSLSTLRGYTGNTGG